MGNGRLGLAAVAFALSLFALACGAVQDAAEAAGAGGNGGGNGPGGVPEGFCSASNACPAGQFCFNGLCAPGCTSDTNCDADKYCDTIALLCVPREVVTCETGGCPDSYACVNGYCVIEVSEPLGCEWKENGTDGCASNELCMQDEEGVPGECLQFPACPQDLDCPVGTQGAVCNVDYIPSKGRICLVGLCHEAADCPQGLQCEFFGGGETLGFCMPAGQLGSQCDVDADCADGLACISAAPGFPAMCQPDGGGAGGQGGGGGCTFDGDCAAGEFCHGFEQQCVAGSGSPCFDDADCPGAETCDPMLGVCRS